MQKNILAVIGAGVALLSILIFMIAATTTTLLVILLLLFGAVLGLTLGGKQKELKIGAVVAAGIALLITLIQVFGSGISLSFIFKYSLLLGMSFLFMLIGAILALVGTIIWLNDKENTNISSSASNVQSGSLTFGQYMLLPLKKYAEFSGRARRQEFWGFFLFTTLVELVPWIMMLGGMKSSYSGVRFTSMGTTGALLYLIIALGLLIPSLAVFARRMHDTGRSGWMWAVGLIPFVGGIILLVFLCQDSQPGDNKYGLNPKGLVAVASGSTQAKHKNDMSQLDYLEKLADMKEKGLITEDEFQAKKKEIL